MANSIDGLWIVWYEHVQGDGRGVVVFNSGRLLGGESAWFYEGTYRAEGGDFSADATLTHFGKSTSKSVLGTVPDQSPVRLEISGRRTGVDTIEARAEPNGGGKATSFELRRMV